MCEREARERRGCGFVRVVRYTSIHQSRQALYLRACVSEQGGDGEGAGSQALSDTLRYINLAGVAIGLVTLPGPMHLCACVSKECGDGEGAGSQALSDTLRYNNLAG
jgi:hypothetical protein